jgi:hypothetical protein
VLAGLGSLLQNRRLKYLSERSTMNLNDLLLAKNVPPEQVIVLRHQPFEPELNKVLPWLAAEKPDVFNAYQQTQNPKVEKAMQNARYIASFIGYGAGKALFVGLYSMHGSRPLTLEEFWKVPAYKEMKAFGMQGFTGEEGRSSVLWFDLELTEIYDSWKGKLVIDWPGGERSWWRWADRNTMPVRAILEESVLDKAMPQWEELGVLPAHWRSALSQWRGIYYIFDISDGKGYIGSAYGSENISGRWRNYAASGHGDNKLLRKRDSRQFRFTILQRVSPDMLPEDVIQLEGTWKKRLHTRFPNGLNEN